LFILQWNGEFGRSGGFHEEELISMKIKRRLPVAVPLLASALALAAVAIPSAGADTPTTSTAPSPPAGANNTSKAPSGNSQLDSKNEWSIELSIKCKVAADCTGTTLGTFSAWISLNYGGQSGQAEFSETSHLEGSGAATGSQHFSDQINGWTIGPNGDFFITDETATFTGHQGGPPVIVHNPYPPYPLDSHIPAAAGHYNSTSLFGYTAPPGDNFQIQVTQHPAQSH
jgi:hypothetical protein